MALVEEKTEGVPQKRAGLSYEEATLGYKNYWYPVMLSRRLGRKPTRIQVLGEEIVLIRDGDKVCGLQDRCAHRGVRLSHGKQEFPGTLTCRYHGWTYDLKTGKLVAALTDGPDSPICGRARVRAFPVEERAGMVWIWTGDIDPVPVEEDIPKDFLDPRNKIVGDFRVCEGDWRFAAENGFDEGHFKYLHRDSIWIRYWLKARFPAWSITRVIPNEEDGDEGWITRVQKKVVMEDEYPGLGRWPKDPWWQKRIDRAEISIRMPGVLRVGFGGFMNDYEWYIPIDERHYIYGQFVVIHGITRKRSRLKFDAKYWLVWRWLWHREFNGMDATVVKLIAHEASPSPRYRPDVSILAWRRLCERAARGQAIDPGPIEPMEPYGEEDVAAGEAVAAEETAEVRQS